jgi:hypothetical protein
MLKLSKKYAISDVGLRKICIGMDIPLPKAGHWMRLQFGKKVSRQTLSENYKGKAEVKLQLREEGVNYDTAGFSERKQIQKQIETKFQDELKVPERLVSRDPMILAAKQSLALKNKSYKFEGLIETGQGILDIKVSVEIVGRALRFMEYFIKILRLRGHDIVIDSRATYALVNQERIKIACREKCKRVSVKKHNWDYSELHGNGLLSFKTEGYHGGEWVDGNKLIEEQVPAIIAKMEVSVKELHVIQEENRVRMEQYEAEKRKSRETEERRVKELQDFRSLLNEAHRWHNSQVLRSYLDMVGQKVTPDESKREEFDQWLTWARQKADWYDPLVGASDELLSNIDRTTLEKVR